MRRLRHKCVRTGTSPTDSRLFPDMPVPEDDQRRAGRETIGRILPVNETSLRAGRMHENRRGKLGPSRPPQDLIRLLPRSQTQMDGRHRPSASDATRTEKQKGASSHTWRPTDTLERGAPTLSRDDDDDEWARERNLSALRETRRKDRQARCRPSLIIGRRVCMSLLRIIAERTLHRAPSNVLPRRSSRQSYAGFAARRTTPLGDRRRHNTRGEPHRFCVRDVVVVAITAACRKHNK